MYKKELKKLKEKVHIKSLDIDLLAKDIKNIDDGLLFASTDGLRVSHFFKSGNKILISVTSSKGSEILSVTTDRITSLKRHTETNLILSELSSYSFISHIIENLGISPNLSEKFQKKKS